MSPENSPSLHVHTHSKSQYAPEETCLGKLSRKPVPVQKREPKTHYLHKKQKMRTVPLDVAPERRTKRCSPRFRPGGPFWNQGSGTCRQAVRERSVGP